MLTWTAVGRYLRLLERARALQVSAQSLHNLSGSLSPISVVRSESRLPAGFLC
jgi:hypothetical protein|eukprot:SAG25_NODE_283_length_10420_cov_9.898382_6_plen_53_part_00